jgi:micrococcal nuclease
VVKRKRLIPTWIKVFLVAFLITVFALSWLKKNRGVTVVTSENSIATVSAETRTQATVVKVIDGDTIQANVEGQIETIRLIGIDAPESVDTKKPVQCFAMEASNRARELLTNKGIFLEKDSTQGDEDIYYRKLRYIFLLDGTNFNKLMVAEGYAREYSYYGKQYKYRDEFKRANVEAKGSNKGLWGSCK